MMKSIKKTLIIIFATLMFIVCLLLMFLFLHTLLEADLSLRPAYKQSPTSLESSLYLISYADGSEVFFRNRNILAYSALNRGVDFIYNYRRSHIEPDFIKNNPILNEPVGAGMWLWKPYLILKTLENIPEGSLLLYADSGLLIRKPIREFIDNEFSDPGKPIMLFAYDPEMYRFAGSYASGDTFYALNCHNDKCRYGHHVWAGIVVVKNNSKSRKFIKDWLDAASDADLLTGTNLKMPNYPEFLHHQHDEGILSVLASRDSELVQFVKTDKSFIEHFYTHRRKSGNQNMSLFGFTSMDLLRYERKMLNRPIIKQLRIIVQKIFEK